MRIKITKTSDWNFEEIREVESLDCLFRLAEEFKSCQFVITIYMEYADECDVEIEIYDDWREW